MVGRHENCYKPIGSSKWISDQKKLSGSRMCNRNISGVSMPSPRTRRRRPSRPRPMSIPPFGLTVSVLKPKTFNNRSSTPPVGVSPFYHYKNPVVACRHRYTIIRLYQKQTFSDRTIIKGYHGNIIQVCSFCDRQCFRRYMPVRSKRQLYISLYRELFDYWYSR